MTFLKQAFASFLGSFIAFAIVGIIGYYGVTNYIDSKFAPVHRVEALVSTIGDKIENLTDKIPSLTEAKPLQRFLGN